MTETLALARAFCLRGWVHLASELGVKEVNKTETQGVAVPRPCPGCELHSLAALQSHVVLLEGLTAQAASSFQRPALRVLLCRCRWDSSAIGH